jgi:hypothetical protein
VPYRLELEEIARLPSNGPASDSAQLANVDVIAIARDGSVIVPQRDRLIYLSPSGDFVRSIGRRGTGPGDFRQITGTGWLADTLWVYDSPLNRVAFLGAKGEVLRVMALPDATEPGVSATFMGLMRDGRRADKLLHRSAESSSVETVVRNRDGSDARIVATELASRNAIRFEAGGVRIPVPQPFSDQPLTVASRDGEELIIIERAATTGEAAANVVVRRLAPTGVVRSTNSYPVAPRPLGPALIDSAVDAIAPPYEDVLRKSGDPRAAADFQARLRTQLYVPKFMPLVFNAVAGENGILLLQTDLPLNRWMLIAANGEYIGDLQLPATVRPLTATPEHLWSVAPQDDGTPLIRRYRIRRTPS